MPEFKVYYQTLSNEHPSVAWYIIIHITIRAVFLKWLEDQQILWALDVPSPLIWFRVNERDLRLNWYWGNSLCKNIYPWSSLMIIIKAPSSVLEAQVPFISKLLETPWEKILMKWSKLALIIHCVLPSNQMKKCFPKIKAGAYKSKWNKGPN